MKNFKKKPLIFESIKFISSNKEKVLKWAIRSNLNVTEGLDDKGNEVIIIPNENLKSGFIICKLNDYIIKNPFPNQNLTLFTCTHAEFITTYTKQNQPITEVMYAIRRLLELELKPEETSLSKEFNERLLKIYELLYKHE